MKRAAPPTPRTRVRRLPARASYDAQAIHSMNYRAVVACGRFERVEDREAKLRSMKMLVDRIAPDRWAQLRPVSRKELNATTVLRLALDEASAKIRAWGPKDDATDLGWPVWAGVLPLELRRLPPRTEPDSAVTAPPPTWARARSTRQRSDRFCPARRGARLSYPASSSW